jgi:hypothetical protein
MELVGTFKGKEMNSEGNRNSYSVQFRLQRVTSEYCYINVPVTHDLMIPQPDGSAKLDVNRLVARAAELSNASGVTWYPEEKTVGPHPIQKPMEPGEERFQGHFPQKLSG